MCIKRYTAAPRAEGFNPLSLSHVLCGRATPMKDKLQSEELSSVSVEAQQITSDHLFLHTFFASEIMRHVFNVI